MILPKHFDQNEWFVLVSLFMALLIVWRLPKRFPSSLSILILLYTGAVGKVVDSFLADPWDVYDIMDTGKYDFFDLLTYLVYALFGYVFVYCFNRLNVQGIGILVYIIAWSMASTGFEWVAAVFGVFTYKGWSPYYSLCFYLAAQAATLFIFSTLIKYYQPNGDFSQARNEKRVPN